MKIQDDKTPLRNVKAKLFENYPDLFGMANIGIN